MILSSAYSSNAVSANDQSIILALLDVVILFVWSVCESVRGRPSSDLLCRL